MFPIEFPAICESLHRLQRDEFVHLNLQPGWDVLRYIVQDSLWHEVICRKSTDFPCRFLEDDNICYFDKL